MPLEYPRRDGWFFLDPRLPPHEVGRSYLERAFGGSLWADPQYPLDPGTCLADAGLEWRVLRWQVHASETVVPQETCHAPRYRALVRSDTREVMAVVSSSYSHVEHLSVVDTALSLARAHDPDAWLLGARALGQTGSELGTCVVVARYRQREAMCIVATNSHGGEGAVRFRVVGVDRTTASVTATGGADDHMREGHQGDLRGRLEKLPHTERGREWVQDYINAYASDEHYMTSRLITRASCVEVVDALWPQAEGEVMGPEGRLLHPREHLLDGRLARLESCWDVYTQLCAYLDHESEARERGDATKDRLERLVRGAGEALKCRAAALVLRNSYEDPEEYEAPSDPDPDSASEHLPPGTIVNQVPGWAPSPVGQRSAQERYAQLSPFVDRIPRGWSDYGRNVYDLETSENPDLATLSDWDLLLLCDRGSACYGGRVERMPTRTRVIVYTN